MALRVLLSAADNSTRFVAFDLATGELAAPVDTCRSPIARHLTRSGSGRTVAVVWSCVVDGDYGSVLMTLEET